VPLRAGRARLRIGRSGDDRRAAVHACSLILAHAPDLVRHGSKPARELAADSDGLLASLSGALRPYDDVVGYPPRQVLIEQAAGCGDASGSDEKAFCCGPVHALVVAGPLVASGVYPRVVVVAGGSLAKLGMKFAGALRYGAPVLEDVLRLRRARRPARCGAPELLEMTLDVEQVRAAVTKFPGR